MTRNASARLAGAAFIVYIVVGIAAMVLFGRATEGNTPAARLARIAEYAPEMRLAVVLTLLASFCAIVLGVTLYSITRDEDRDLAMLGLTFRVAEGVLGGMSVYESLGLLWLATAVGPRAPDTETARALAAYFFGQQWSPIVTATFFAVGSTFFSWLLLRGRMIPVPLAWLGVFASVLLVVGLPLRIGALLPGFLEWPMWMPMLVFELGLALWFIVRGVAAPRRHGVTTPYAA
jgi:hypothetical protein